MVLRETVDQIFPELAQRQRTFLLAGAAGGVLSVIGYATNPEQFFTSYLMAYMLALGLTMGALAFTMIHQLSGGAWGVITRQSLGAATRVIPVLTVLFLPIIAGMHHLYEWTHADVVAADPLLADAIVGCGIDKVDAGVQNRMQQGLGRGLVDNTHAPGIRPA